MRGYHRIVAVMGTVAWATIAAAQNFDRPKEYVPLRPPTQKELDRRQALDFYVLGALHERGDRLLEAIQAYEKAARLDPEAAAVFKALVPFYLALDRVHDAITASRKVVELDPEDFESWYMYARQLKITGKAKEARTAIDRGLKCEHAKEHPESLQAMHFLLGNLREENGDYRAAAEAYLQAGKILEHPDAILEHVPLNRPILAARCAEIYERAGTMYLKAKRFDDAVSAFRQAQDRHPQGAGRLNFNLAQVYQEQGDLPKALAALDAYLRLQPQGLEAYELKMTLLRNLRRDAEILPWLEGASAADGFNMGLKLLLARTLTAARTPDAATKAEKIFRDVAAKAPSAEVYRGLFKLHQQNAKLGMDRVLETVNTTLAGAKDNEKASVDPAQGQAMIAALREEPALGKAFVEAGQRQLQAGRSLEFSTVHLLAVLAERNRQLDAAEVFYRQALHQPTDVTETLLYSGLMRVLWKAHKYGEVMKVCQDGLRQSRFTRAVFFHNERARALGRLGKFDQALAEVERGLDVAADPERFLLRHLRIRLLTMADKFDRAEAECQEMIKEFRQPGETLETRYLLSNVYSAAKNYPKAEDQLAWVLRVDPNNATANNDLGYLWADQNKNLKEAEELIRKAIELDRQQRKKSTSGDLDSENAAYIDSLGWVLFRQGQSEAARRELERAVALPDGEDPTIWDHLGDVYYRLREIERARTAWQRAMHLYEREKHRKMDPRYKDLERKFKLLDSAVR